MSDMTANLREFNREIDDFARKLPEKVTVMQKKIVLEALRRLIQKTPVDTGRARLNWQVTIDHPAEGQLDLRKFDKAKKAAAVVDAPPLSMVGQEVITEAVGVLRSLPPFEMVWISNNVDYIEFLEHGSSQQAPEGMLAVTIEELRMIFP